MLTKTLREAKKKQRSILIKAMNNDIGSIDSAKDSWNPAQISERAKDISYIRSLVDTWNPAQLNEALRMLDLPVIDTWNPAQIEEQRRNLVFYLDERTLIGNPITLKILGNLTPEVTNLTVTMNPIQDLHGYDNPWAGGAGKNKFNDTIGTHTINANTDTIILIGSVDLVADTTYTVSCKQTPNTVTWVRNLFAIRKHGTSSTIYNSLGSADTIRPMTYTPSETATYDILVWGHTLSADTTYSDFQVEVGSTATSYAPYSNICPISGRTEASVTRTAGEDVETKTHQYSETIYGGVDDFVNGGLTNEWGYIASYDGETLPGEWISDRDVYAPDTTPTTGAEVCYKLATPTTIETTPEEITLLKGTNVLSTDGDSIELKYKQNF